MSKRLKIAGYVIIAGCGMFFLYGISIAILSEAAAAYQYGRATGKDFMALSMEAAHFAKSQVFLVGILGAGCAICAGALFYIGVFKQNRLALVFAIVGGIIGPIALIVSHSNDKAWLFFIIDNVALNTIGIAFGIGGKQFRTLLFSGKLE